MENQRFYDLVILVFETTFGIKKHKNEHRGGNYTELFVSDQLGDNLKAILEGRPIHDPDKYITVINSFFSNKDSEHIAKATTLFETLSLRGYLDGLDGADILSKCDKNTMGLYKKLLLDIWNYYYEQYSRNRKDSKEAYSISQDMIDSIIKKYTEYRLPANLDYYQQRIPDIMELLKTQNLDNLYSNMKSEYIYFFKKVMEDESFYKLNREERSMFFDALYTVSDLLNRVHHEDSYKTDLAILTFLNDVYNDDYMNIDINAIRKIQGCLYAIAIENSDKSLCGNMRLTKNRNLTLKESDYKPITQKEKLDMCNTALKRLLYNKTVHKLDAYFQEANDISIYENRVRKRRYISPEEINTLYVLSLLYSNIAICNLQYVKWEIKPESRYKEYAETCEIYHDRTEYLRGLILKIREKTTGKESPEYTDALLSLAMYYNSVATRQYYTKKYADSILIRSVLYTFYMSLGLKDKARTQLDLAPVKKFEEYGGNAKIYNQSAKVLFEKHKKNFAALSCKKYLPYDEFKEIIIMYQNSKELF